LHFAPGLSLGGVALSVVVLGAVGSVADPTAIPWKSQTSAGRLHTVSAALSVLVFPPATTIVGWNPSGAPASTQSLLNFSDRLGQVRFMRRIDHLLQSDSARRCVGRQNRLMMGVSSTWLMIMSVEEPIADVVRSFSPRRSGPVVRSIDL
jgi:hypothetical protein